MQPRRKRWPHTSAMSSTRSKLYWSSKSGGTPQSAFKSSKRNGRREKRNGKAELGIAMQCLFFCRTPPTKTRQHPPILTCHCVHKLWRQGAHGASRELELQGTAK